MGRSTHPSNSTSNEERIETAASVRDACVRTIVDAYEDAGIRGLCGEGRFEAAIEALRRLDVQELLDWHDE